MNFSDFSLWLIDYSTSTRNRKRIVSSFEIGLGLLLIALGVGTASCVVEYKEAKNYEDEYGQNCID